MATTETPADAATVGRAYFEAVGRRDLDAMTAFYEPGGTGEIYGLVELRVPDTYRAWFGNVFRAFPNFKLEIVDLIASGRRSSCAGAPRPPSTARRVLKGSSPTAPA